MAGQRPERRISNDGRAHIGSEFATGALASSAGVLGLFGVSLIFVLRFRCAAIMNLIVRILNAIIAVNNFCIRGVLGISAPHAETGKELR